MDVNTLKNYIVEILQDIALDEAMVVGGAGGVSQIQGFSGPLSGPPLPKLASKTKKRAKSKKKKKSQ
jgi:hypothetical protein